MQAVRTVLWNSEWNVLFLPTKNAVNVLEMQICARKTNNWYEMKNLHCESKEFRKGAKKAANEVKDKNLHKLSFVKVVNAL